MYRRILVPLENTRTDEAIVAHGHRGMKDLIYGSVANEVRHQSFVPVLLVRERPSGGAG